MITSIIGKLFLDAYNEKFYTNYDPKTFFNIVYYPLFFDSNKYMQWVQNSPFVQMNKGQKVGNLDAMQRKEKLRQLHEKIDAGITDASIAIGYPASEEKEYATTSGQVSSLKFPVSKDDVYLSWIGSSLGIGVKGGFSILFSRKEILLDLYEGWKIYRRVLDENNTLKGLQITSWNGQWISHVYEKDYDNENPMANFNPFSNTNNEMSIETQNWTQVLIGISIHFKDPQMMGYVYSFGKTNKTIGFIPFNLIQIRRPFEFYRKIFNADVHQVRFLWETEHGFAMACKDGSIGVKALEPKGLRKYMESKITKGLGEENVTFNIYKIWILAMLNNQELWEKSEMFAHSLIEYASEGNKGKTGNSRKIDAVISASNKKNLIQALSEIVSDCNDQKTIKDFACIVNTMPSDNVTYFLALIRFNYAAINNLK